ncbi:site-specific integrase, partial [Azospira sp. I13]|uniref:tyrosine-type recombinase/integrase n=1 Tax=Azospira sp. I13 TaxID=1765050 RepID=UPI001F21D121
MTNANLRRPDRLCVTVTKTPPLYDTKAYGQQFRQTLFVAIIAEINARTGRALSPATVRLDLALLSDLFRIAKNEWGICNDNPVANVRKPKLPPGRDRRLAPREERMIMRHCSQRGAHEMKAIVQLALETAMRQGEILGVCWEHINLKSRIVHLPDTKNGSKRDIPLSMEARDILAAQRVKLSGRVFSYTNNVRISFSCLNDTCKLSRMDRKLFSRNRH